MTNEEIVASLHKMVDQFGEFLKKPAFEGTLPTVRITMKPDEDGDRLTLTVGAEYAQDEDE